MQVFLLRHGETELNAAGVLRGQLDIPLNTTGEAEAASLAEVFRRVPLSAVVSSPLLRAADTARHVAAACVAPLEIDERLRDRYYGDWAGHALEDVERRFGSIDAAPSVEAWELLQARAEEALLHAVAAAEASNASTGDTAAGVALVTHDAVLRALLGRLLPALSSAQLDLPTGSWSELVPATAGGHWRAAHLGEPPASAHRPTTQRG